MASKNPYLKKANVIQEWTPDQIQELAKCADDPVYFISTYCKLQHPVKGAIPFKMYEYQKEMVRSYQQNRLTIVLCPRQGGKSQTSAAFLFWLACFHDDKTILIASNKNSNAMEMIHRIRFMYENLPMWLKPGLFDDGWNRHQISFDNGSRILSQATTEETGRGLSLSLIFLDEVAFVPPRIQEALWTSLAPTLATGGSCIMTSTPNGDKDLFASLWRGANQKQSAEDDSGVGRNGFKPVRVEWSDIPGRDEKFIEQEIAKVGELKVRQEYFCEFLSSDPLLIDTVVLNELSKLIDGNKPYAVTPDGAAIWKPLEKNTTYLVGIDPATGSGNDYTTIQVFSFPKMVQMVEFRSNSMSSATVYQVLKRILNLLEKTGSEVYFSTENNGVGEGIIALYEADENPSESALFVSETGSKRPGFSTTSREKIKACIQLKDMVDKKQMEIMSPLLLGECKDYVRVGGSYAAKYGSTDDLISGCLIVIRILQEISNYEQDAFDKLYSGAKFDQGMHSYDNWTDYAEPGEDDDSQPLPMIL